MLDGTGQATGVPEAGALGRGAAAGRTRLDWRGRVFWGIALAVAGVVLSWCYILQARSQPANSDGAGMALQGWDMLHGNLLLRGWWTTDVSFYTFEIPIDALVIAVRGLSADVVHVTAGIVYALLVLSAALLARGTARGRAGVVRAALAAGIMIAPELDEGTRVLLGSPDHVGVGVPILLTLLLVDRARERWLVPVAVGALLLWAQLDDPVAEFAAALPIALVCLVRAGLAVRRKGWRDRSWRYDGGLVLAAAVSYELAQIAIHAIRAAGGLSMRSLSAATTFIPPAQWGTQLVRTGENALLLFGADVYWQRGWLPTMIAVVHLVGAALALAGLVAGIAGLWRLFGGVWGGRPPEEALSGGVRVTQVLALGVLANLGASAFVNQVEPGYGAHEIAVVLPFCAALAGRAVGPWLLRRRRWRGALTPALGAVAACYLAVLGYSASQPSAPAPTQSLAGFLAEHGLTSGIGRYWSANLTTAASDWHVRVIPAEPVPTSPYSWLTRPSWYDPDTYSANFVIAGMDPNSTSTYLVSKVLATLGPPAREYRFDGYVIMVYDRNLLSDMNRPVQPSPELGSRL